MKNNQEGSRTLKKKGEDVNHTIMTAGSALFIPIFMNHDSYPGYLTYDEAAHP